MLCTYILHADSWDELAIFISNRNNGYYALYIPESQLACVRTCVNILQTLILVNQANSWSKNFYRGGEGQGGGVETDRER